ncbi:MAG: RadC family protein [Enterococcus sp.]
MYELEAVYHYCDCHDIKLTQSTNHMHGQINYEILLGLLNIRDAQLLAKRLYQTFPSLFELKDASLQELEFICENDQESAYRIKMFLELSNHLQQITAPKMGQVHSSVTFGNQMIQELRGVMQEHLIAIYLNTKNEIIQRKTVFIGSLNQSIAHPREIFNGAVRCRAARVIIVHNHPSGNPQPSENDLNFTQRLIQCGELLGIELLDHIITGNQAYISLREENELDW